MQALSKAEFEALAAECRRHDEELNRTGRVRAVESLEWDTRTLRPRGGKTVVTDGPFAEAKEQVGSILVIEAEDVDDPVRIASLHPAAQLGEDLGWWIELRPIAAGCHP
ncbi:MAG TPA: YciI family protein [Candidatus Binatia bacterium]